jgi:hypothetical protein
MLTWTWPRDSKRSLARKVDLVTERSIRNPYFRKTVEASRVRIYDRRNSQAPV